MQKLEGCDDRAMVLDGNQLQVLRYGAVENQHPIAEVGQGELTRDDKGRLLGIFGKPEERVRFGSAGARGYASLGTTIWVADVNTAIEAAG
jgi:hypothetical protein